MNAKVKGSLLIIVSAFGFAMMSVFVNLAGDAPIIQKLLFRNLIPLLVSYGMIRTHKIPIRVPRVARGALALRIFFGLVSAFFNFFSITRLLLANANSLNKLSPFFAILCSALFLHDALSWKQIGCVGLALAGCVLIIAPDMDGIRIASLAAMAGGITSGAVHTCTRYMRSRCDINGWVIIFIFSSVATLIYLAMLVGSYEPVTLRQLLYMIGAGSSAVLGQITMTNAYRYAPPSEITVYDCTQIVFGGLLGFLIFGQIPSALNFVAYTLIIVASVTLYYVNRHSDKKNLKTGNAQ